MGFQSLQLDYVDIREFLFKSFGIDLNPITLLSLILQLAFIGWIIYQIYQRFKGTQAERVMRGLMYLVPLILGCYLLKLTIITKLIEIFSSTILIGLIVIFAPEFRRMLMQLGGQFSSIDFVFIPDSKKESIKIINEILEAIKIFQKDKTGCLIVIEKAKVDRYYVNPGQPINAAISKELLLTLFTPKSPLHDGAVTIRGNSIVGAGVILPMTENPKLDWQYGTRHRAAIGFSEVTDSLCIVVSEETGEISMASQGRLAKYKDFDDIRYQIEQFYSFAVKTKKKSGNIMSQLYDVLKVKNK